LFYFLEKGYLPFRLKMTRIQLKFKESKLPLQYPNNSITINTDPGIISEFLFDKIKSCPPLHLIFEFPSTETWLIANDPVGSQPIFYLEQGETVYISDSTSILSEICSGALDPISCSEFITSGYTTGERTLLPNVKQLQAGEYLLYASGEYKKVFYNRHLTNNLSKRNFTSLKSELSQILLTVFSSLIKQLNGRHALVSLSGGLDSRLIVYWLHKLGYTNFSCFTYGRTNNIEIENAKKTCNQLGIEWHFIDYMDQTISSYIDTDSFKAYFPYMANHSSMFFMQDYFAVKYLRDSKRIPDDTVFIPGHTGDVLAGGHLNKSLGEKLSKKRIALEIYKKHFILTESTGRTKRELLNLIRTNLAEGYPSHLIFEDWELRGRQAKFIINSARIYSFFGYSYLLPLWDQRLIAFFKELPFEYKLEKYLYKETLKELFNDLNLNFTREITPSKKELFLHSVKQEIGNLFPKLKRLKRLPLNDKICYKEITDCMLQDMRKNSYPLMHYYNYNGIIVQYYIFKLRQGMDTAK
jgi:asparagine synthase (glutamine-hydrolysing)